MSESKLITKAEELKRIKNTAPKIIDARPVMQFIEDGLNGKHQSGLLHFGHDAIEILTELEFTPNVGLEIIKEVYNVRPNIRGAWIDTGVVNSSGRIYQCSACGQNYNPNKGEVNRGRIKEFPNYCPECGAVMNLKEYNPVQRTCETCAFRPKDSNYCTTLRTGIELDNYCSFYTCGNKVEN